MQPTFDRDTWATLCVGRASKRELSSAPTRESAAEGPPLCCRQCAGASHGSFSLISAARSWGGRGREVRPPYFPFSMNSINLWTAFDGNRGRFASGVQLEQQQNHNKTRNTHPIYLECRIHRHKTYFMKRAMRCPRPSLLYRARPV